MSVSGAGVAGSSPALSRPSVAPPVFWPRPVARVLPQALQQKIADVPRPGVPVQARLAPQVPSPAPRRVPAAPPVHWPARLPGVLQHKTASPQSRAALQPALAPRSPSPAHGQTIQRASESKVRDVIREFNDLRLLGPETNLMGAFDVEVPKKSGELVAVSGVAGPGGAYLTASGKVTKAEKKMVDVYFAASGRPTASGKLRDNTEEAIRLWLGKKKRQETSGLDTQAQHVVPFSELHHKDVVKFYTPNSEHPFNSQLLPNKTQFRDELESLVPVWSASPSGLIELPSSGVDYSELSGSFHQGYHSAYSKGTWAMMEEVLEDLASKNGGKWTSAMMEAAIFHAQKGARGYASALYPLYRHFKKGSDPIFAFPHFSASDVSDLEDVTMADASDQNEVLSEFVKKKVLEMGKPGWS